MSILKCNLRVRYVRWEVREVREKVGVCVSVAQISHIRWECLITSSLNNIMVTPATTSSLSFLIVLTVFISLTTADVNTMTDKILKDILKDYNPDSRPAGKLSDRQMFYKLDFSPEPKLSDETS